MGGKEEERREGRSVKQLVVSGIESFYSETCKIPGW